MFDSFLDRSLNWINNLEENIKGTLMQIGKSVLYVLYVLYVLFLIHIKILP